MGGEKILEPSMGVGNFGSPPRGRGKVGRNGGGVVLNGITPAWAGKRFPARMQKKRKQDHPRVGGEKRTPDTPLSDTEGSPPRRRGKVTSVDDIIRAAGITPA